PGNFTTRPNDATEICHLLPHTLTIGWTVMAGCKPPGALGWCWAACAMAREVRRPRLGLREIVLVDGIGARRPQWKFTLYQVFPALSRHKACRQWKRQGAGLASSISMSAGARSGNRTRTPFGSGF